MVLQEALILNFQLSSSYLQAPRFSDIHTNMANRQVRPFHVHKASSGKEETGIVKGLPVDKDKVDLHAFNTIAINADSARRQAEKHHKRLVRDKLDEAGNALEVLHNHRRGHTRASYQEDIKALVRRIEEGLEGAKGIARENGLRDWLRRRKV